MQKLKFIFQTLLSFIPRRLPQGMKEFKKLVDDIAYLSELPNNDKLKKVIATLVLQLPPTMSYVSKRFIVSQIQKAAANQVAVENLKLIQEQSANEKQESPRVN